jgi:hypothetical protein
LLLGFGYAVLTNSLDGLFKACVKAVLLRRRAGRNQQEQERDD